jgi:tRNA A-37 threonylcarbamoyl transferase component Bud32
MADPNDPVTSAGDPLDTLIALYMQQVEAGQVPDREALLAAHPDLADRLRAFFADLDQLDRQAAELRLSADPNPTTDETPPAGELPRVRYFGDYELLEVIAHGGMGVVYKARQVSLNRLVALKMILRGELATPRDVARFRAEAEAAANLDHPHIVPIYEVGEHDGQQYYAMRYIEGTSLARRPRATARQEAALVAIVARAIYHAHQHGILHRDLKPSNILVDSAGTPYVADFGLAKRVDAEGSLTESGALVGTPHYMAPEQAAGRKDLTVAADVYSLGGVLYERLTGQTPFHGETALEILRQVRDMEPPRPSSVIPGLNRDLETICLKCLEKDPAKRYGSAEAFADDLECWLRGEPIQARPVGQAERLWRWCKRNPRVAGLSAGLAAALLAGTTLSLGFALRAEHRREQAEQAEADAVTARDDLEVALARSLVRPLNPEGSETLNEPEVEALWELAQNPGERIWSSFLEEATRNEITSAQLRARAEPASIAAIGLNRDRRPRAEQFLAQRLRDPRLSLRQQWDLTIAMLGPGELHPSNERMIVDLLLKLASFQRNLVPKQDVARQLVACAKRLSPNEAARLLTQALEEETNAEARGTLAEGVAALAERMESAAAAHLCAEVARFLILAWKKEERYWDDRRALAEGLASVTWRMEPGDAVQFLTQVFEKENDWGLRVKLVKGLVAAMGRLESAGATRVSGQVARFLTQAWEKERDRDVRRALAELLAAVALRMDPSEATQLSGQFVRRLSQALEKEKGWPDRAELVGELGALATWMEPVEASRISSEVARLFAQAWVDEVDRHSRWYLFKGMMRVSGRLSQPEAAQVSGQIIRVLSRALEKEKEWYTRGDLAWQLGAMAGWMDSAQTTRVSGQFARLLTQHLEDGTGSNAYICMELAHGLGAVARRLSEAEAAKLCIPAVQTLVRAAEVKNSGWERYCLEKGVASIMQALDPVLATQYAKKMVFDLCAGRVANHTVSRDVNGENFDRTEILDAYLTNASPLEMSRLVAAVGTAVGLAGVSPFADLPALPTASIPLSCRLSTQDLVELLKMPTCFGKARRVVLQHLGNRYGRRFANHWEFVRYAQEHGLDLDFTTPPRRPSHESKNRLP